MTIRRLHKFDQVGDDLTPANEQSTCPFTGCTLVKGHDTQHADLSPTGMIMDILSDLPPQSETQEEIIDYADDPREDRLW